MSLKESIILRPATLIMALFAPAAALAACPGETQAEMTQCAYADYQQADTELNAAWQVVKPQFDGFGAGDGLLDAQRKWLAYRDAACDAEAAMFEGGSIQPMVKAMCLTRLTQRRTEDLLRLQY